MIIIVTYYNLFVGLSCFIIMAIIGYFTLRAIRFANRQRYDDLQHISYQIKNASEHLFHNMPIGLIVYDSQFKIKWANPYIMKMNHQDELIGKTIIEFSKTLMEAIEEDKKALWLPMNDFQFKVE